MEKKILIAYFSCSGVTRDAAKRIAKAVGGDLFEIMPKIPYTEEDLNWENPNSRSSLEMNPPVSRPEIAVKVKNIDDYGVVFVGFPIWWYIAPTIINTFLESYNMSGKTVIPFGTSGGSGFGQVDTSLRTSCPVTTNWRKGMLINDLSKQALFEWIASLKL